MKKFFVLVCILLIVSGCGKLNNHQERITVYSPYPRELIRSLLNDFEQTENVKVELKQGSTQVLLREIHQADEDELGDIVVGGVLSEMIEHPDDFEAYESKNQKYMKYAKQKVPYVSDFILMPTTIVVNKDLIGNIKVRGYKDLCAEELKGKVVYSNPLETTTGYQHMKAIESINHNVDDVKDFMATANKVDKSSKVIQEVANGKYYAGLSYESDAKAYINKGYPLKMIYPSEGTMLNHDGIALVTKENINPKSKKLINYLTSKKVQQKIADEYKIQSGRKDVFNQNKQVAAKFREIPVIEDDDISHLTRKQFLELIQ
ncbi:extracellular solute-binding protein [Mammaliicoccus sciuri]|uniref:extracellular solute-binding protein n=1 Tax=Mammaliicoccus sciuri TaxID=1296 RepID=UPI002B259F00|nr:extracellular solute-binding protein [Mammaliicoccus sciuri]WQJ42369.1 extracellular solute-binding protein [Mammaliicoccus sciuri]